MKAVRPFIALNGVPYLQMRSVGSQSTSGREKERIGGSQSDRGWCHLHTSVKLFWSLSMAPQLVMIQDLSASPLSYITLHTSCCGGWEPDTVFQVVKHNPASRCTCLLLACQNKSCLLQNKEMPRALFSRGVLMKTVLANIAVREREREREELTYSLSSQIDDLQKY